MKVSSLSAECANRNKFSPDASGDVSLSRKYSLMTSGIISDPCIPQCCVSCCKCSTKSWEYSWSNLGEMSHAQKHSPTYSLPFPPVKNISRDSFFCPLSLPFPESLCCNQCSLVTCDRILIQSSFNKNSIF
jgi:hypothetical protein